MKFHILFHTNFSKSGSQLIQRVHLIENLIPYQGDTLRSPLANGLKALNVTILFSILRYAPSGRPTPPRMNHVARETGGWVPRTDESCSVTADLNVKHVPYACVRVCVSVCRRGAAVSRQCNKCPEVLNHKQIAAVEREKEEDAARMGYDGARVGCERARRGERLRGRVGRRGCEREKEKLAGRERGRNRSESRGRRVSENGYNTPEKALRKRAPEHVR